MAASSKAGPHWTIFGPKGAPTKCHKTPKAIDKAKAEVAKLAGYSMKETPRERCPFCNPKPKPKEEESGQAPEPVTLQAEPEGETKPGYCHNCNDPGPFKLLFVNHVMVRECRVCGVWFNLETCKPWEG